MGAGAIVTMMAGLAWPLLSFRLEAMGYAGTAIGLSTAAQTAAMILIAPLVPWLARKVGAIRLMLLAVVNSIAVLLAMAAWESYASWLVLRFLLGCGLEMLFILSDAWVIQLAPERQRGRILGVYTAVGFVGFAGGPLIIDAVGSHGWAPFLGGVACAALAAVPLWLVRRVGPALEGRPSGGFLMFLRATPTIMLAGAMYGFIDVVVLALFPVYGLRSGLDEGTIARLISLTVIGAIVCQFIIGWLCDRVRPSLVLVGCTVVAALAAVALPFVIDTGVALFAVLCVWGGVMGGFFTVGMVLLGRRYDGPDLLTANTVFVVMFGLGSTVGPTIGGAAMDAWDPHGMVAVVAMVCVIYLIFLLFRPAEPTKP
jgi:MFS family permease